MRSTIRQLITGVAVAVALSAVGVGAIGGAVAQSPSDAIALHGVAGLPGHREADPRRGMVATVARLHHEGGQGHARARGCSEKISASFQPLHGGSARRLAPQAERRLRPCARRAAITLRPPTVAMRARKPCLRLRTSLLG